MVKHGGRRYRVTNALFSAGVIGGAATLGTLATDADSAWYRGLDKPEWQPERSAFPVVWSSLYAGAILTSTHVLNTLDSEGKTKEARAFRRSLVTNMALNAAWSWTFFQGRKLGPAALGAAALALSSASLTRRAEKAGVASAIAFVPYVGWTSFATGLASEIWLRNQQDS